MKKRILVSAAAALAIATGTLIYVNAQGSNNEPTPVVVEAPQEQVVSQPVETPVEPIPEPIKEEPKPIEEVVVLAVKTPEEQLVEKVREHSIARGWDSGTETQIMWGGSQTQVICAKDRMRLWGGATQENVDKYLEWYLTPTVEDINGVLHNRYFQFSGAGSCSTFYSYRPM